MEIRATAVLWLTPVVTYLPTRLVGVRQQPGLQTLQLPLDPSSASPTPGPGACLAL